MGRSDISIIIYSMDVNILKMILFKKNFFFSEKKITFCEFINELLKKNNE